MQRPPYLTLVDFRRVITDTARVVSSCLFRIATYILSYSVTLIFTLSLCLYCCLFTFLYFLRNYSIKQVNSANVNFTISNIENRLLPIYFSYCCSIVYAVPITTKIVVKHSGFRRDEICSRCRAYFEKICIINQPRPKHLDEYSR